MYEVTPIATYKLRVGQLSMQSLFSTHASLGSCWASIIQIIDDYKKLEEKNLGF
jgi:hypothetical protein